MEIYIGMTSADVDLTLKGSPSGLWIKQVPPDHRVIPLMELPVVFEVGSFMGCACGLNFGEWSHSDTDEHDDRRRANVAALAKILAKNADHIIRILTPHEYCWQFIEEFPRRPLDLDAMSESRTEFSLEDDCAYEIWPPGTPGPSRIDQLFEPHPIAADEIRGIAPELFNYREDFGGKSWDEVPQEVYERHGDAFNLMDMETMQHFLPGYLMAAIEPGGYDLRWSIECFTARDKFKTLHDLLNPEQQKFFLGVVDFLMRDEGVDESAQAAYEITRESRHPEKPS